MGTEAARYHRLIALTNPFPNFDVPFMAGLRSRAAHLLALKAGDRVLDMGCGPGGAFRYLVSGVGPSGEVVGVEIGPDVASSARRRVSVNGWSNVHVIEGDARTVALPGTFDALLMFGAPDVYASREALENILPVLRPGARVVLFGARTRNLAGGGRLSRIFRALFAKATFPSTPRLDDSPWQIVAGRLAEFQVELLWRGWMFLAWGILPPAKVCSTQ